MKVHLSPSDLKRIRKILEVGHRLEKVWPLSDRTRLDELQNLIAALVSEAEGEDLKRLAFHARNLTPEMTTKHLAGILVPFERLDGKALRDDDFMIDEGDHAEAIASVGPLRVIADNLRSAFNVGSLLRTAESFGVEEVILTGYTPTPEEPKTAKTSLGAQDSVKWSSQDLDEALSHARERGYEIVALETLASAISLADFQWPEKTVLLLGNERFGLDDYLMKKAQHFVRIPLYGRKNSLNVGIAAGVALADWRRKLESKSIEYKPIGTFRSASVHKYEAPRQGIVNRSNQEGEIQLRNEFTPALKDLEGFERIWIVYDFHHNKNWKPLVLPPRGPHEKRGVFATRSPYRPTSIGLSCVDLVRVEGSKIVVRGYDLLDNTPILDVKPYIPYADSFPHSKTGWLEGIDNAKHEIRFSAEAYEQLEWLESNGVNQLRSFLTSQLEFNPTDAERKRVSKLADSYRIAYRTWRADFVLETNSVVLMRLSSGYTEKDLVSCDDKYGDHDLHRRFIEKFQ